MLLYTNQKLNSMKLRCFLLERSMQSNLFIHTCISTCIYTSAADFIYPRIIIIIYYYYLVYLLLFYYIIIILVSSFWLYTSFAQLASQLAINTDTSIPGILYHSLPGLTSSAHTTVPIDKLILSSIKVEAEN